MIHTHTVDNNNYYYQHDAIMDMLFSFPIIGLNSFGHICYVIILVFDPKANTNIID